jgi:hypothetical protein
LVLSADFSFSRRICPEIEKVHRQPRGGRTNLRGMPLPGSLCRAAAVALLMLANAAIFTGCVTSPANADRREREAEILRHQILALGKDVSADEAGAVAGIAVQTSADLQERYRAVWPPWLHNNLVNLGLRERGLCYHWANDLFAELQRVHIQTLTLRLVVARMDTPREHNAVLVSAAGQPISAGLVLDAWRRSGRLWWGVAAMDKYPWQPLPYERMNPDLQKFVAKPAAPPE